MTQFSRLKLCLVSLLWYTRSVTTMSTAKATAMLPISLAFSMLTSALPVLAPPKNKDNSSWPLLKLLEMPDKLLQAALSLVDASPTQMLTLNLELLPFKHTDVCLAPSP